MFIERKTCPVCGGNQFLQLHETPYSDPDLNRFLTSYYSKADPARLAATTAGGAFAVLECQGCRLLFQRDVPDDALLFELYGQWLGKNDELAPHQPPMPMDYYASLAQEVMQIVALMRRRVGENRRLKFFDFGMGWGHWAQMARALGVEVYGLEYSPEKIAHAKSNGLRVIDGAELNSHQFDFINTEQVIEHLVNPRETVAKLVTCLAPRGILKLSVPDGRRIKSSMRAWRWNDSFPRRGEIMEIHPLEHVNCFTSGSLTALANACHLKRIELPLTIAYAYSTSWTGVRPGIRKILQPIKRFVLKRGCYALFCHTSQLDRL